MVKRGFLNVNSKFPKKWPAYIHLCNRIVILPQFNPRKGTLYLIDAIIIARNFLQSFKHYIWLYMGSFICCILDLFMQKVNNNDASTEVKGVVHKKL